VDARSCTRSESGPVPRSLRSLVRRPLNGSIVRQTEEDVRTFTSDGRGVRSFGDFVAAANVGLVGHVDGKWNGNLDALNDYLSWVDEEQYELKLLGSANCAETLDHAAQAAWLRDHLATCHPSNVAAFRVRLTQTEAGLGETLFDVIRGIVSGNPHIRLVLR
jgi:hypothetical protein